MIFLSWSLTKTSFSPCSAHFLAQSALERSPPLEAHLASVTQPVIPGAFAWVKARVVKSVKAVRVRTTLFIMGSPGYWVTGWHGRIQDSAVRGRSGHREIGKSDHRA